MGEAGGRQVGWAKLGRVLLLQLRNWGSLEPGPFRVFKEGEDEIAFAYGKVTVAMGPCEGVRG